MNLKEMLKNELNENELKLLVGSFDIIGSIAIIDIPEELKKKEKLIAEKILELHRNVKTVCKRAGEHTGVFRIRPVKVIAGEKTTETTYVENGARMRLDVNQVYFTPRLSYERNRIAEQVKKDEKIGVWFAGVGPFSLVIFKKQPNVKIYSIELNPIAYEYMVENVRINKAQLTITPIFGDVKEKALEYPKLDKIAMPLPKDGEDFLETAFDRIKKNGIIYFYSFSDIKNPFEEAEKKISEIAEKCKKKIKIINKRIVRPFSPSKVQVVFDIKVL